MSTINVLTMILAQHSICKLLGFIGRIDVDVDIPLYGSIAIRTNLSTKQALTTILVQINERVLNDP